MHLFFEIGLPRNKFSVQSQYLLILYFCAFARPTLLTYL